MSEICYPVRNDPNVGTATGGLWDANPLRIPEPEPVLGRTTNLIPLIPENETIPKPYSIEFR
jgi:hypothetical protein